MVLIEGVATMDKPPRSHRIYHMAYAAQQMCFHTARLNSPLQNQHHDIESIFA
ncbi:Uncharacterised protein [Enterobacter hormaechei]|nr:Uncharacterised protein [Enterobacter hormaechei]CZY63350.1 Uncharacterised protein [Enterobacter hormaechei]CZY72942.1 Uncharacterised protein [Enterobacter hormaechei]SAF36482.1 Uncharacterised protein [Enterobacter hormaechei]